MPALLTITDLHKAYGAHAVLDGANVTLGDEHKVGVIGRNGAGKSTLCRIILGEETADSGSVSMSPHLRLSYLEQHDPFHPGESVLTFLMRYSEKEDWQCGQLAGRFLLKNDLLAKEVHALSGGFQTRVKLCAMLLKEPNFLILDEPTNYLDLKTLLLLERFLINFRGGYLIVSHDRAFLNRTCTHTLEVERGQIALYPGDVDSYLAYKQLQRDQATAANANAEIRRKQLQTFVDKNKAKASKATQAASKLKMLERLEFAEVETDLPVVTIRVPSVEARKGTALRLDGVSIGYADKMIASGIDLEIERGRRVAVLGENGQGKSTFIKTIAGALAPQGGTMAWGYGVRVGAYAQHVYGTLPDNLTVFDYLERCAAAGSSGTVLKQPLLDMAGSFLFRGEGVQKRIGVLSGGERSRLTLAGLLLGRFPALLLDEPTNHLDFETVEALAYALKTYDGTLFIVSHDRTFTSIVADTILEVRDGRVGLFPGDYAAYVARIEQEARDDLGEKPAAGKPGKADSKTAPAESPGKLRQQLTTIERSIATLDREKHQLMEALAKPGGFDAAKSRRLDVVVKQVEAEEAKWLAVSEQLEGADG